MSSAGFVGLAGRPNVGKSTLVNALVGSKIAITSDRPQTTRRAARGVLTDGDRQVVLIDLPGVQKPQDALTRRMQSRVETELAEADIVLMVLDAHQGVGPGDRFIANVLLEASGDKPVLAAVNKVDRLGKQATAAALQAVAELEAIDELFPVCATNGSGVAELARRMWELAPEGPHHYPPGEHSDQDPHVLFGELVREQTIRRTRQELPHAVEVVVTDVERREDGLTSITARIWVESDSQKAIVVGRGGRMIRDIGSAARRSLQRETGGKVFLDLTVKVRKDWRRDETMLDRFGIE
ncbi:MAG: GTPase Era [Solirubrobacterales bacterium]